MDEFSWNAFHRCLSIRDFVSLFPRFSLVTENFLIVASEALGESWT